jgi:hypothetical protein
MSQYMSRSCTVNGWGLTPFSAPARQRGGRYPVSQHVPTRLSAADVLTQVAAAYRIRLDALLDPSHRDAYQTAVYLLHRAANEPLQTVAVPFRVSPLRISKIQQSIERNSLTPKQLRLFA